MLLYEYSLSNGACYTIMTSHPLKQTEQDAIERCLCETDNTLSYFDQKRKEENDAPLD